MGTIYLDPYGRQSLKNELIFAEQRYQLSFNLPIENPMPHARRSGEMRNILKKKKSEHLTDIQASQGKGNEEPNVLPS